MMIEDCVVMEFDEHDVLASHGLPEHQLDALEREIVVCVTTEARHLDPIDYELRLRELRGKVNALPPALQAELRGRFSMEVRA